MIIITVFWVKLGVHTTGTGAEQGGPMEVCGTVEPFKNLTKMLGQWVVLLWAVNLHLLILFCVCCFNLFFQLFWHFSQLAAEQPEWAESLDRGELRPLLLRPLAIL